MSEDLTTDRVKLESTSIFTKKFFFCPAIGGGRGLGPLGPLVYASAVVSRSQFWRYLPESRPGSKIFAGTAFHRVPAPLHPLTVGRGRTCVRVGRHTVFDWLKHRPADSAAGYQATARCRRGADCCVSQQFSRRESRSETASIATCRRLVAMLIYN